MTDSPLAAWDSRRSMRHVRTYPHPIERVWEAITTAEHLEAWMLPRWTVDLRIGGVCTCTYGDTSDPPGFKVDHVIIELDPPRVVDYGGLRFELEPVDGGNSTRLTFIQSMPPEMDDQWSPDFCSGYHTMLDRIPAYLDGKWTLDDTLAEIATMPEGGKDYRRLIKRYESEVFTLRPAR